MLADEMLEFINNLRTLIEQTYVSNSNKKVVVLGHSMGNLYILYLLNHQSKEWKDMYIQSFISLAGPWGGAVKTLKLLASGNDNHLFQMFTQFYLVYLLPAATFNNAPLTSDEAPADRQLTV